MDRFSFPFLSKFHSVDPDVCDGDDLLTARCESTQRGNVDFDFPRQHEEKVPQASAVSVMDGVPESNASSGHLT